MYLRPMKQTILLPDSLWHNWSFYREWIKDGWIREQSQPKTDLFTFPNLLPQNLWLPPPPIQISDFDQYVLSLEGRNENLRNYQWSRNKQVPKHVGKKLVVKICTKRSSCFRFWVAEIGTVMKWNSLWAGGCGEAADILLERGQCSEGRTYVSLWALLKRGFEKCSLVLCKYSVLWRKLIPYIWFLQVFSFGFFFFNSPFLKKFFSFKFIN